MFVLDTNSLIYFFKGQGRVAERLLATPPSEIGIPAIVLYELEVGIAKSSFAKKRRKQLAELVDLVNLLPFGEVEARSAAVLRAALEKRGNPIGPIDTLIAGTAVANRAALVTHNVREFGRVSGLEVVDWY
jgi:tRNA(fMet)-specific endonuclease VapC